MTSKTIPVDETLTGDALKFAREHDLVEYVEKAVKATREVFADAERIAVSLKRDEYGDQEVNINAFVHDEPEAEAEKYSECVGKWVSFMPPKVLGLISLSTSWAS